MRTYIAMILVLLVVLVVVLLACWDIYRDMDRIEAEMASGIEAQRGPVSRLFLWLDNHPRTNVALLIGTLLLGGLVEQYI